MRLAFVQADLGTALHVGIEHPVDDEECPFYPSDFLEGFGQRMLAGVGCEFAQQLAGWHDARDHGCSAAQDVWPVGGDDALADFAADQALQSLWDATRVEDIKPLGGQIADAGNEPEAQEGGDCEDVVGKAASVGVLLFDIATARPLFLNRWRTRSRRSSAGHRGCRGPH